MLREDPLTDFVLVHGAWHGAWCWRRVLPALWKQGHRVFTVSLTGVGERAHLLSPAITLDTHIEDVVSVLVAEELENCVLVGHSYAGTVITGAAARQPQRIGKLVYLDAVVPRPGAMAFALMVVATILAVRSFDPRLVWDVLEPGHG